MEISLNSFTFFWKVMLHTGNIYYYYNYYTTTTAAAAAAVASAAVKLRMLSLYRAPDRLNHAGSRDSARKESRGRMKSVSP